MKMLEARIARGRAAGPPPPPRGSRPLRDASLDSFGRPMRWGTLRALRLLALVFYRVAEGERNPVLLASGGKFSCGQNLPLIVSFGSAGKNFYVVQALLTNLKILERILAYLMNGHFICS